MASPTAWIDASGGISGDMLLGACLDAGVQLGVLEDTIAALGLATAVSVHAQDVRRNGFRATRAVVTVRDRAGPSRTLRTITDLLRSAPLPDAVAEQSIAVFERLARAESRAHGISAEQVHFHEVGALDSIVDIVGTLACLHHLDVQRVVCGPLSLGGGWVTTAHGRLSVPGPAVLELLSGSGANSRGGPVEIELATPTGVAIAVTLADNFFPMPPMTISAIGVGAGTADPEGHSNICRLVIGQPDNQPDTDEPKMCMIETNVDDLDPRLWPGTLSALMEGGAADAWLTPILMKKGRPAHTLHVLSAVEHSPTLMQVIFHRTSSIGLRTYDVDRTVLQRDTITVHVDSQPISVKRAWWQGRVLNAEPEFGDVEVAARVLGLAPRDVLGRAQALVRSLPPTIGDETGRDGDREDGDDDQH